MRDLIRDLLSRTIDASKPPYLQVVQEETYWSNKVSNHDFLKEIVIEISESVGLRKFRERFGNWSLSRKVRYKRNIKASTRPSSTFQND